MATLPETDRARIWRGLMRYWSGLRQSVDLSKTELRAAVDATDTWIDDNQASYNSALPSAAQSNLTTAQKTLLFCVVAAIRVSVAFARALVGEVD
jgi:hypothetical protein